MNELLKKITGAVRALWSKWTLTQKLICFGIAAAVIAAAAVMFTWSAKPTSQPLFNTVLDESTRAGIKMRLEAENVPYTESPAGIISVDDRATALRMRALLFQEGLVPSTVDPWALFDTQPWTVTDFQNNVNLRRALQTQLKQHLEALSDIVKADVIIAAPEKSLFTRDQQPVTVSVGITPKQNSDITTNTRKIQGIQKLLEFAVPGLKAENITINDVTTGLRINDFDDAVFQELARTDVTKKQQQLIAGWEKDYREEIKNSLQKIFGSDRVREVNVKVEMDMSTVTSEATEITPIIKKARTPGSAYDDSELLEYIPIGTQTVTKKWTGTSLMPEGPAGAEGQNPPVYSDANTMAGTSEETAVVQNNAYNQKLTKKDESPAPGRRTVSVNIDGTWKKKYDEKGKPVIVSDGSVEREYTPVDPALLAQAERLVQDAIGYNASRGDSVSVTNIPVDRTAEFRAEDTEFLQGEEHKRLIFFGLAAFAAFLLLAFLARFLVKENRRRKRLKEEELARRQREEQDGKMWQGGEPVEVTMSVEERRRAELQENAVNMAKEHPDDVAMLLRTWLMEE